jgi:hypothetical protein
MSQSSKQFYKTGYLKATTKMIDFDPKQMSNLSISITI